MEVSFLCVSNPFAWFTCTLLSESCKTAAILLAQQSSSGTQMLEGLIKKLPLSPTVPLTQKLAFGCKYCCLAITYIKARQS